MIQRKAQQRGQGLVEYMVAVIMIIGVFGIIDSQIRRNIGKIWRLLAKDIAAGCPGCTPPEQIR